MMRVYLFRLFYYIFYSLTPDHGYPARVVLPGIAGCRNVKWVQSIKLSKKPSDSPWMKHYYRMADGSPIQKLPMNSIILSPEKHSMLSLRPSRDGSVKKESTTTVTVTGVAYTGGNDSKIVAVDVTADGGKTWIPARLISDDIKEANSNGTINHDCAWVRFIADMPITISDTDTLLTDISFHSRATDSQNKMQPRISPKQRGYLYDGWGFTKVSLKIQK